MRAKYIYIILAYALTYIECREKTGLISLGGKITNPIGQEARFIFPDTTYSAILDDNGRFEITFSRDSSSYLRFGQGSETTFMYLSPGDNVSLKIDTKEFDETIEYKNSAESSFLAFKFLLNEKKDFYGEALYLKDMKEYKEYIKNYADELLEKLDQINNSDFILAEKKSLDNNTERYIQQKEKLSSLSKEESIFAWEKRTLSREYNFYQLLGSGTTEEFNSMLSEYKDHILSKLSSVNNTGFINKEKKILEKDVLKWKERRTSFDNMPKEGEDAIDFSYPDKEGNVLQLSSFQGSMVYVDVWATWCGPCIAQIPALEQLQKDYKEENIIFMSVSVDTDKDAWLKMLHEDQLQGVQLWADGWSDITRSYAIFGIPRFLLFDSNGKVISVDAPRPTSGDIREMIDNNL